MDGQKQQSRTQRLWWLLIAALLLWNVWVVLPARTPVVAIPYTTLLAQVRAGKVTSVHISGDEISGVFKQPYTPPASASASAGAADQTQATPSAGATPTASGNTSQNQQSYTDFRTTFPQAVGDPTFLPLLEQYGVSVEVSPPYDSAY